MSFQIPEEIPELSDESLNKLTEEVQSLRGYEAEITRVEEELSQLKELDNNLRYNVIPKHMFSLNLSEIKLKDGTKVTIKSDLRGSLPKDDDKRGVALNWLDQNIPDIIKDTFTIPFGKGDHEEADLLQDLLNNEGYSFIRKEDVHHSTLKASVKKYLEDGKTVPLGDIGLVEIDKTVIK